MQAALGKLGLLQKLPSDSEAVETKKEVFDRTEANFNASLAFLNALSPTSSTLIREVLVTSLLPSLSPLSQRSFVEITPNTFLKKITEVMRSKLFVTKSSNQPQLSHFGSFVVTPAYTAKFLQPHAPDNKPIGLP